MKGRLRGISPMRTPACAPTVGAMLASRSPRRRRRVLPLALLPLAAAAVVPASAAALSPPVQPQRFSLSRPAGGGGLDRLVLRATCQVACTVRLKEATMVRYRTRGGLEQLAHGAEGALRGSRRIPAGRTVEIPVALPPTIGGFALAALGRREAVLGHVTLTVTPSGGMPTEVVRQFSAVAPGTPAPFKASDFHDTFVVPKPRPARASRARYRLTLTGTQTSRWSYDRSTTEGACRVHDSGSGRQTLRFRSTRAVTVEELVWRTGEPALRQVGTDFAGVFVPVRVEADRDSTERKGADGDCGGSGGGGDGGERPECVRRGARDIYFMVGFLAGREIHAFTSVTSFPTPSAAPDCPVELAAGLRDPLDVLVTPGSKGGWLANGGGPGKVIAVYRKSDTTRIGGGTVRTTARFTVTFQRVGR